MTGFPQHDPRVAAVRRESRYGTGAPMDAELERLSGLLGWGSPEGGPFGGLVPAGARVLIKPNWVLHENHGPWGLEPLVTHGSLVRAVASAALRADPGRVVIGDAPLQACDFDRLMEGCDLPGWADALSARDSRFGGLQDFRRTRCVFHDGVRDPVEDQRPLEDFVLFDLGTDSLLEPISGGGEQFRVTQYPPALLARTHGPGRHQYLVARHVIEADVIFNLPKLKTHKKAGITCALKNLIGINGNKEFLPHHRLGGPATGGDCYPEDSRTKLALERVLDRQNTSRSPAAVQGWNYVSKALNRVMQMQGDQLGVEGSWSGNDTIWRTCLDLNRILIYGRTDGTLADVPQRRVVQVVDAVVAGQGDGPLCAEPLPLGLLLGSGSPAAADWVGSFLLGYRPERIPITRHAFGQFRWPIAPFSGDDVELVGDLGTGRATELLGASPPAYEVRHPIGWRDAAAPREAPTLSATAGG